MCEAGENNNNIIVQAEKFLDDTNSDINTEKTFRVPIDELNLFGMGIASIVPVLRTATTTTTIPADGLYRLVNAELGDALKKAKDGNLWGAIKKSDNSSKMAKFASVTEQQCIQTTVLPIDPTTMMISIALYSVEKQMNEIKEIGQEIITFLEIEKESKIESDVETLLDVLEKYKYKWDDELFVTTSYKLIFDIQRSAREHMRLYQKKVTDRLNENKIKTSLTQVKGPLKNLLKDFKYYRMSLYTFAMASFLEILLGGNFKEEYVQSVIYKLEEKSFKYRELYSECSKFLEKQVYHSFQTNAMKGIGIAGNATGKLIGKIPVVKNGKLDEILQDSGNRLKDNADDIEKDIIKSFAKISNPSIAVFTHKMEDMILIYNHTKGISFDVQNVYLEI